MSKHEEMSMLKQLAELGIRQGDVVMVHASMKALKTTRTPESIINDLMLAVGEEGTLMFPALTYDTVTPEQPEFYSDRTVPAVGLLPRVFMNIPGVVRSLHPTHSVCAWGKHATEITQQHELDETPVGAHSPFMHLPRFHGKILFIGDVLHACTFMHGVEEVAGTPYTLTQEKVRYVVNGEERYMYAHDFSGWGAEYGRIRDILSYPDIRTGFLCQAPSYLIDAHALLREGVKRIRENPFYFVTDISMYE